jgi:alkylation response protein AidB-like acyl-CoA dehydrogenase
MASSYTPVEEHSELAELREELLARARELVPVIAGRAAETERQRHLPRETLDALIDAGLLRIATPRKWGGYGLEYDTAWEVATVLGQGCGSTAWCYMLASVHNWQMGLAPERAQEEYFTTPDQLSASAFAPPGKIEPVDGGYMISGRWSFSSGVDHANWGLCGVFLPAIEAIALFLVPREQFTIHDDWHTSGMCGTGSKTLVVAEPVFVPSYRYTPMSSEPHPEARLEHDRGSYGAPFWTVLPFSLIAPLLGMAKGMLAEFIERGKTKVNPATGELQALDVGQQLHVAEASADIDAAFCVARARIAELIARGRSGQEFTTLDRSRFRRDHAYVARLCVRVANRLFAACGGTAIYETSPLQRFHRDINAGSHHIALGWEENAERYGRARFGLALAPPGRY